MAEYGIVMSIKDIKGNIQVEGYKETIGVMGVTFASAATRTSSGTAVKDSTSVSCAPIQLTIQAGKWTAELLQACYNLKKLGDIVITQVAQAVDKDAKGKPTVLQTMTLTAARCVNVSQIFEGGGAERSAGVVLEYDKILIEIDKKPADFTVRNVTAGAT